MLRKITKSRKSLVTHITLENYYRVERQNRSALILNFEDIPINNCYLYYDLDKITAIRKKL